jgi:hypothetical protein
MLALLCESLEAEVTISTAKTSASSRRRTVAVEEGGLREPSAGGARTRVASPFVDGGTSAGVPPRGPISVDRLAEAGAVLMARDAQPEPSGRARALFGPARRSTCGRLRGMRSGSNLLQDGDRAAAML